MELSGELRAVIFLKNQYEINIQHLKKITRYKRIKFEEYTYLM